jgi:hypothetical protein
MSYVIAILLVVTWFACGVVDAGFTFAYFQRHYPSLRAALFQRNQWTAATSIFGGPCALLASCAVSYPAFSYGWLWPWSAKARAEAGISA